MKVNYRAIIFIGKYVKIKIGLNFPKIIPPLSLFFNAVDIHEACLRFVKACIKAIEMESKLRIRAFLISVRRFIEPFERQSKLPVDAFYIQRHTTRNPLDFRP